MISERWIWPSVIFLVLSSLSSRRCGPSETLITSPIIGVNNVLAQSEHEMFFLPSGRRQTSSLSVWDYVRGTKISPRILGDRLWRGLAPLLLFGQRIEIEYDRLFLHHLILSDLGKTAFFRRCTSRSAVTLHLFLVALGAFKVAILLCVPSRKAACEELATKHRLINDSSRVCRTGNDSSLEEWRLNQSRHLGLVVVLRLVFLHFISTYILFHT